MAMAQVNAMVSRWWQPYKWFFVILAGVILLRIPNIYEPYWYGDEGIYLSVGQALSRGDELYAEIMDHKTPMIYWMAAFAGTLSRFKVLLMMASLVSVTLFYAICRKMLTGEVPQLLATALFALATTLPRYEGNIANGELLLMPFVLGAVYLFWRTFPAELTRKSELQAYFKSTHWMVPLIIGALFGMAVLTKVPAGFDMAALVLFLLMLPTKGKRKLLRPVLVFIGMVGAGFLLVILASIGWFRLRGTMDAYFEFGLLYNFRYIESWGSPFTHPLAQTAASTVGRLVILGSYLGLVQLVVSPKQLRLKFALIWLAMTLFAAILSLRPYPHYFIQVVPAAVLVLGLSLQVKTREVVLIIVSLLMTILVVDQLHTRPYPTVDYYKNFIQLLQGKKSEPEYRRWFDAKTSDTYTIARWIKEYIPPYERLYIHGSEPMVYALANRSPVGRYLVHFHVASVGAFDEVLSSLNTQPPKYILDYIQTYESFPDFYDWLRTYYEPYYEIGSVKIYQYQGSRVLQ